MISMFYLSFCVFFLGVSAPSLHKAQLQSEQSPVCADIQLAVQLVVCVIQPHK